MKTLTLILFATILSTAVNSNATKTISKNKMTVSWYHQNDSIYFEMNAPTTGWVTIGFNTNSGIKGAYLLMGNIVNGKANVVEHYTLTPGNYKPLKSLGADPQVTHISGMEANGSTQIKFALPTKSQNKYQKDLTAGNSYSMILAYSRADDFQHHSMMRTAIQIKL